MARTLPLAAALLALVAGPATAQAPPSDHLAKAAELLDRGDDAAALPHLAAHVAAHPRAVQVRAYLAELCFRLGRSDEARHEFTHVLAEVDAAPSPLARNRVQYHTRLMELARRSGDRHGEELHRGAGLLLLAKQWDADPGRRDAAEGERTVARAAAALRLAAAERPADPRARLLLADALAMLGQGAAASAERRAARRLDAPGALTAAERGRLTQE